MSQRSNRAQRQYTWREMIERTCQVSHLTETVTEKLSQTRRTLVHMATTTIEWTWRRLPDGTLLPGYTFNPWWGCCKVSQECTHCYAEGIAGTQDTECGDPP